MNNFQSEYACNLTCSNSNKNYIRRIGSISTSSSSSTSKKPLTRSSKSSMASIKLKPTLKTTTVGKLNANASICQWVCNINCPFGYKKDFKTNCYKCECIDMAISDCGVPCWNEVMYFFVSVETDFSCLGFSNNY